MVHHVSETDSPGRSPLPQSPLARLALLSAIGAAGALVLLAVTVFGGLERADAFADPEPAGTELENDLVRITPHEARVITDDGVAFLQVRADIEMHGSERPVSTADALEAAVAHLEPSGDTVEDPEVHFQRMPDGYVSHLQPHMPETDAILSWQFPEGAAPEDLAGVLVAVHETERLEARGGGGVLWVADQQGVVGSVSVPLEGAES